ncbi:uncharacterized protein ACB058_013998 [Synchiropus picturatus]
MDIESPQKSSARQRSCLDRFLMASILLLFLLVSAVAAGGAVVLMKLQAKLDARSIGADAGAAALKGEAINTYKMQNFAYVEATKSELKNSVMSWAPVSYKTGKSVGDKFHFSEKQHSLTTSKEGSYFIYLDLNLTCTHHCSAGLLTVTLGDKLTCQVQLPTTKAATPVSQRCWTVARMEVDSALLAHMTVPEDGLRNWKLELKGSNMGIFLVD